MFRTIPVYNKTTKVTSIYGVLVNEKLRIQKRTIVLISTEDRKKNKIDYIGAPVSMETKDASNEKPVGFSKKRAELMLGCKWNIKK